ncbi:MAG: 1-(5-phosphoribosyl)-5-[(5-phosphoribosylamino)methylideneamino]imidazole-4-carboxamide isomerase [Bacteroidota bacterium]
MQIIPAIDIIGGQCVRLTQGDYDRKKVYDSDPLAVAQRFEQAGLRHLHLVDLDGAKASRIINHPTLRQITSQTQLHVDFGGGIKSDQDIQLAFDSGAQQVTVGTISVKNRPLFLQWLQRYGSERIILGADVSQGMLAVSGWQEQSQIELFDFLEGYVAEGVRRVICTDIAKDGLLSGPAVELYVEILRRFPDLELVASGGVTTMEDLYRLREMGCTAAIVGKAIYEGRIGLEELRKFVGGE